MTITLKNNLEAKIWEDTYLDTMADRVMDYTTELPFGVWEEKSRKVAAEVALWADEVVLFYRGAR